jgi:NADH-quinone oxidoreductase subunit E
MMTDKTNQLLSADIREHIDQWNKRYPADQKRSGVLEALRVVQEKNGGSLTTELMEAVADYLDLPHIAVFEVATFYSMYFLTPVGRHVIDICTNISCVLNGADKLVKHAEKTLGVDMSGTTSNGQFTLREVECLGACVGAPACMVGKKYYENVTPEKFDDIVRSLNGK